MKELCMKFLNYDSLFWSSASFSPISTMLSLLPPNMPFPPTHTGLRKIGASHSNSTPHARLFHPPLKLALLLLLPSQWPDKESEVYRVSVVVTLEGSPIAFDSFKILLTFIIPNYRLILPQKLENYLTNSGQFGYKYANVLQTSDEPPDFFHSLGCKYFLLL